MCTPVLSSSSAWSARGRAAITLLFLAAGTAYTSAPTLAAFPAAADLQIRATANTFEVGKVGFYNISITNAGPHATNAPMTLSTDLPNGLRFASISGGWTCVVLGSSLQCVNVNPLAAGASVGADLGVNVRSAALPSVQIRLTIAYDNDPDTGNNSVVKVTNVRPSSNLTSTATATPTSVSPQRTPTPAPPTVTRTATITPTPAPNSTDVSLTKTLAGPFTVGRHGTYTLWVGNLGSASTNRMITVVDTLPASLNFILAIGTDWTCSASGRIVVCQRLAPLDPGTVSTIALVVRVSSAAYPSVTNSARVSYVGDTDPRNNLARKPTTVRRLRPRTVRTFTHRPVH